MAFGQAHGYPATRSQMAQLTQLVAEAGHADLRDARGPLGLTQRQAAGRFTREEADELIALLQGDAEEPAERPAPARRPHEGSPGAIERIPSERLAAELQRRGWIVVAP